MSIFDNILSAAAESPEPVPTATFDGERLAPSADFVLPVAPATKTLYAYQLAAVESILTQRRVLLGLQPGLGKTAIIQAVCASVVADGGKAVVVVPPSLKISPWANEFAVDYPHLNVEVISGTTPAAFDADADVVIVPDSVLVKRLADVEAFAPSALFVDEAHRFKSRDAKRSKALYAYTQTLPADTIVCLATGTLVSNRAGDVWQPLAISSRANAKAVSRGASWSSFLNEWCETETVHVGGGRFVVNAVGCKDPEGLRAALVSTCFVSVPREAVLDLPPRTTAVRSLVVNGSGATYRRAEKEFLSWVKETRGDAALQRARKAEAITKLQALWEQDGLAKVPAVVDYVSDLVEQGEPVVLFAHHKSVVAAIYETLLNAGIRTGSIIGGQSAESKAATVDQFQAGQIDVLIGNIEAAGTGLTLTRSAHVAFAQLPFSSGSYGQACDRVYRIGQTRHVTTHVLNLNEGVSERLWAVLGEKAKVADAINTGTPSTIDFASVEEQVLSSFGW
jgi:SWI/SNF-related matrix-associated actin-dependent regulator 1 of chromatin subfamily A